MTGAVTSATTDVMDLLAPIRDAYVRRRTSAVGTADAQTVTPTEPGLTPVIVEAIVTVDREGRVPWRFRIPGLDLSSVTVKLGGRAVIEVQPSTAGNGPPFGPDRKGRLHLPFSLLRVVGSGPGDRLALLRLPDRESLGFVPVGRLGLRTPDHEPGG